MKEEQITIFLTNDEAFLFKEFQKRYQVIASIVGTMDTLGLTDVKNASLVMDFDALGTIAHTSITKHYRK